MANRRYILSSPIVRLFIFTTLVCACSKTNYTTQVIRTNNPKVIVVGRIKDKSDNTPLAAVQISTTDNLKSTSTDREGNYKLELNKGHYKLRAIWIGYFHNYTNTLNLKEGDSVIINFRMKADTRPLID